MQQPLPGTLSLPQSRRRACIECDGLGCSLCQNEGSHDNSAAGAASQPPGYSGGGPSFAVQAPGTANSMNANSMHPSGNISAVDLQGCWGCVCLPGFAAFERKRAEDADTIVHEGICLPLGVCYSEPWQREKGNTFRKVGKDDRLTYTNPHGFCFGPGCTWRISPKPRISNGEKPPPRISASEIAGCWTCCVHVPGLPCCAAIETKTAKGEDTLLHTGVCWPLCICYSQPWDRVGDSNTFQKRGKDDTLTYHSPDSVFGPSFCSCKLC